MKKILIIAAIFSFALTNVAISADSKVVATVNGEKIYQSEVDRNLNQIPNFSSLPKDQQKVIEKKIVTALAKLKAVIQEAKKLNIQKSEKFQQQLEDFQQQLLYTTLLENHINTFVTDKKLKEYYNKHKKDYTQDKINASHILVEKKEEAVEIIQKLDAGEDFEKLAKEHSTGPSAKNGGSLGWFTKDTMVKEFSDAAFKLKKGEFTKEPVQTQFGWHVIIVKETQVGVPVPFEDVKEEIKEELSQEEVNKYLSTIINKADIEIHENK